MRTVSFYALGCKANQEEMECLVSRLGMETFRVVPFGEPADWTVVNTCTVTGAADSDSRQLVRAAVRRKGDGRVVVTGCLAQRDPAGIAALTGVDWVVGNAEKPDLAGWIIAGDGPRVRVSADATLRAFAGYGTGQAGRRRRATLKIQDGCDQHCTFCVIPSVRGASRSRPLDEIRRELETLVLSGYREVALTGINTALWGRDLVDTPGLPDLLDALARVPGLARVRLNSLEPQYVTDAWLDRFADSPVTCRHFHFPLQSGDASVLRRMNRRYEPADFARLVERVHARMPDAAIGCDVMVGFPGETAAAFERTERFLDALPLAYAHVFSYSERPGTAAPRFGEAVDGREKRRRSERLRALSGVLRRRFASSRIGDRGDVLLEAPSGAGHWQGLTGNYLRVRVPVAEGETPDPGRTLVSVFLTGMTGNGLMSGSPEEARA